MGAYRNDTLTKKIYYVPKDSTNESLLYDFNLVVGDTIKGYMKDLAIYKFGATFYAIIDSVDSVLINSSYRKRWYFNSSNYIWGGGKIIEGIGNTLGLLEGLLPTFDDNGTLVCHSENGILLYGTGSCSLITNIENTTLHQDLKIYPNPVTTDLYIDYVGGIPDNTKIEIYSIIGTKVKSSELHMNKTRIDLTNLNEGIYFVSIWDGQHNCWTKKIIKNEP